MKLCLRCGERPRANRSRCLDCAGRHGDRVAVIDGHRRFDSDPDAIAFVLARRVACEAGMARFAPELDLGATMQEIADLMGCTRQRIEQIEAHAIKKLRAAMKLRGLEHEFVDHLMHKGAKRRTA